MFKAEDRHWWYRGMAKITCGILNRWYSAGGGLNILDAGCGTGAAMTTYLAQYGQVAGFDRSTIALQYCISRKAGRLAQASADCVPFKERCFDLVTSFDVLSDAGVENDRAALGEFYRVLTPGGRLLLRLPAYAWLRGNHDRAVLTSRRYTARQACGLLAQSGFAVDFFSYVNTLLFPLIVVKRLAEKLRPVEAAASDLTIDAGLFNGFLQKFLEFEALWLRRSGLPFGLSLMVVGRKP